DLGKQVAAQVEAVRKETQTATDRSDALIGTGTIIILVIAAGCVIGAVLIVWLYVGRNLIARLMTLDRVMARLAEGDLDVEVPPQRSGDELGRMANTLVVFKQNALAAERSRAEQANERVAKEQRSLRLETLVLDFEREVGQLVGAVTGASAELE